jgi:cell division protein FtsN
MGPNSFRNLTYAAVMAVIGILAYLIYQSSQKQAAKRAEAAQAAEMSQDLRGLPDTLGSLAPSTTSTLGSGAAASNTADPLASPAAAGAKGTSDVKNVTVEDITSLSASGVPSSSTKTTATGGGAKKPQSPATRKPVKFDAGGTGEFMAMAGAFASKDNADALVAKLKKLGFTKAEVVKLENSANVNVVAGYYPFKGGADAAVRTLKANKIDGFIRKKSGEIFKPTPAPAAKPAAATKPATKPAAKPTAPASKPS